MKVICISGKAQHGKDTTANAIKDIVEKDGNTVVIAHYGDLVKYVCEKFFSWDGVKNERGRSLLQYVGTDVVRNKKQDFWVDFIYSIINLFPDLCDYMLIPDTRFPNEIDSLRARGIDTYHLRVNRKNFISPLTIEQQNHPSETSLDGVCPDCILENCGSLDELKESVETWVKEELYGTGKTRLL